MDGSCQIGKKEALKARYGDRLTMASELYLLPGCRGTQSSRENEGMDLQAPYHPLGHTEAQIRALLGEDYERFSQRMLMRATARDENGHVFYDADLRWYFSMQDRKKFSATFRPGGQR